MKTYSETELTAQPIGYWTGAAYRAVVGRIRADLALEQLTQPHWWILNHVAGAPGTWERTLSEAGEQGRLRARERGLRSHEQMHEGTTPQEYAAMLTILRRVIDNLGGDSDLP
jgi:hypothetical protein